MPMLAYVLYMHITSANAPKNSTIVLSTIYVDGTSYVTNRQLCELLDRSFRKLFIKPMFDNLHHCQVGHNHHG
jgi:hypothetical protein